MQNQSIVKLFSGMFNAKKYSILNAKQFLEDYGGILCLLNDLKTNHREGIPAYEQLDHTFRAEEYGRNQLPPGESLLKKSIYEERDIMVNLLFYLLTLRVCVKLLLVRDQYFELETVLTNYQLNIFDEFISYILLFIMIFLKARVNIEYFDMDQDERKYKNEIIKVKRDGEIQQIEQKNLLVGDILITQRQQIIRIDGIIISCKKFMISQAQTILRLDSKMKQTIWEIKKDTDPFVLAGSSVVAGEAEILVCTVGQNCSFRIDKESMSSFFQSPPLISKLKNAINSVENAAKILCVFLPTWLSIAYLQEKSSDPLAVLTWVDFLYILKVYCAFIGLICFLQRLKILKSVNFFMETHRSGNFFRIKNKSAFEKFSRLDILFVQWSTIALRKREQRQQIVYQLDHLSELSEINNFYNIKIITEQKVETIQKIFGEDLKDEAFFQASDNIDYSEYMQKLMKATFITQSTAQDFLHKYLPIFRALNCQIGYVSNLMNPTNQQVPEDVLHIGFHRLSHTQNFKSMIPDCSESVYWIKLQNKMVMQDVLYQIILESFVYANLFNTYFSLFVNNLFVFLIFCWYSFTKKPVNLYYSLAIIIVNRYLFFTVYRRIALETRLPKPKKISAFQIFKLNILLLPYYIYVAVNLNFISNLFVFFIVNSMLRIETFLFKTQPSKSIKQLLLYTGAILVINLFNIFVWYEDQSWFNQELKNLGYTIGLVLLFFVYAPLA